ncbi:OmpW/AlkL family protein [Marinobacter sp.]|uniref:OmpW/AlkL family protein n=1 Tax=Marinobacter sp. TaxID=50741 RepID=UPI002B48B698|nr:OmpW family outer membrane protein [Marinobacter sp.]HKK56079.1 OmpW family outer membrane protein [Marinobacter sp.]
MSRSFQFGFLAAGLLAAAPLAQAYESGDVLLRAGPALVDPDATSTDINSQGLGVLDGWRVDVQSATALGITATYMLTSHIGVGLLASTPFKHDIVGAGVLGGAGKLAETKHLPPTLTLQYFPMPSGSNIQPYAGVGVNYTIFFDEQTTGTLTGAIDQGVSGAQVDSTELRLEDSIGLAAELGVDVMLDSNFGLNAAVWWADIDTDGTIIAREGNTAVDAAFVDVDIDPLVYMIGFTYRF